MSAAGGNGGGSGKAAVAALLGNTSVVNRLRRAGPVQYGARTPHRSIITITITITITSNALFVSVHLLCAFSHAGQEHHYCQRTLQWGGQRFSAGKRAVVPKWAERRWLAEVVGSQPQLFSRPE
jgi:hypothetical protein